MSKKKRICFVLSCVLCMILGNATILAAGTKEEDVIYTKKVTLEEGTSFHATEGASSFQMNSDPECLRIQMNESSIDLKKAIKEIEEGGMKPLLETNLPEGVEKTSKMEFTNVEGKSNNINVSKITSDEQCSHEYTSGMFSAHTLYEDNNCQIDSFEAIRCESCNMIWVLERIGTSAYRVCSH